MFIHKKFHRAHIPVGLFISAALLLTTSLTSTPTQAETFRHYVKVSGKMSSNLIIESEDKKAILEETGNLAFFQIDYLKIFANNVFFGLSFEQGDGTLDWDGYSQARFRYQTETEYYLTNFKAVIGRKNPRHASYIGFAYRFRERNILTKNLPGGGKIDGLYEELQWVELLGGYDYYFHQGERSHFKFLGELAVGAAGDLHVEFSGKYDPANVEPGQIASLNMGIEYFYNFSGGWGLSFKPAYRYTYMDASQEQELYRNGQPSGAKFHQPVSEYQEMSFEMGLARRF